MNVLRLLDGSPTATLALAVPTAVWLWGAALERLAIGIERMRAVALPDSVNQDREK